MKALYLPSHVYFCGQGDALVFLDLKRDEYTMLHGEEATAFRALCSQATGLAVFSGESPPTGGSRSDDAPESHVANFVSAGLVTSECTAGKPMMPIDIEVPRRSLIEPTEMPQTRVRLQAFSRFLCACVTASYQLRYHPIDRVVASVRRRRARATTRSVTNADIDQLVAQFQRLRGLYPRKYLCLFDSLALLHFLAFYGVYPSWTFAVQFEPWAAHCWVQDGDVAFNETVEETLNYVPIMAV